MIQAILSHNHKAFTELCYTTLINNTPTDKLNILLIENGSTETFDCQGKWLDSQNFGINFVQCKLSQNYGCAGGTNVALAIAKKLNQDLLMVHNDHCFFPDWILPFLENKTKFDLVNPWVPYGLPIMDQHPFWANCKYSKDELLRMRLEACNYPEDINKLYTYLVELYGADFQGFVDKHVKIMPPHKKQNIWWAGCWCIYKDFLQRVPYWDETRGIANDDDYLWWQECLRLGAKIGMYNHSYVHHFGAITTRKMGLELSEQDRELQEGATQLGQLVKPIPDDMTDEDYKVIETSCELLVMGMKNE